VGRACGTSGDNSIRLCGDYKITVHQASQPDPYPISCIEDLYATLAGGKTFTKLDTSHAYQQLELDVLSLAFTTINTHRGLFQHTRLPFDVSASADIFQRTIENVLQGIPHVCVYLDDILITCTSDQEHLQTLELVLQLLESSGLRLRRDKCTFNALSIVYLGHKIDHEGLHPTNDKVRAIQLVPAPNNVTELKSFLGFVNYYGKVLPDLSTRLVPLHLLLRKQVSWKWGPSQDFAFQSIKNILHFSVSLVHYDPKRELILSTDASPYGVGDVLSHPCSDGFD